MARGMTMVLLALTLCVACAKKPTGSEPVPAWLAARIHDLESQPVANPPAYIARYDYQGAVVYYLPPRCCDVPSDLYDAGGTVICHPDGGISGGGDGRCPDFFAQRTNEKIIWRDSRGVI